LSFDRFLGFCGFDSSRQGAQPVERTRAAKVLLRPVLDYFSAAMKATGERRQLQPALFREKLA
jgi:hypothetical protein